MLWLPFDKLRVSGMHFAYILNVSNPLMVSLSMDKKAAWILLEGLLGKA